MLRNLYPFGIGVTPHVTDFSTALPFRQTSVVADIVKNLNPLHGGEFSISSDPQAQVDTKISGIQAKLRWSGLHDGPSRYYVNVLEGNATIAGKVLSPDVGWQGPFVAGSTLFLHSTEAPATNYVYFELPETARLMFPVLLKSADESQNVNQAPVNKHPGIELPKIVFSDGSIFHRDIDDPFHNSRIKIPSQKVNASDWEPEVSNLPRYNPELRRLVGAFGRLRPRPAGIVARVALPKSQQKQLPVLWVRPKTDAGAKVSATFNRIEMSEFLQRYMSSHRNPSLNVQFLYAFATGRSGAPIEWQVGSGPTSHLVSQIPGMLSDHARLFWQPTAKNPFQVLVYATGGGDVWAKPRRNSDWIKLKMGFHDFQTGAKLKFGRESTNEVLDLVSPYTAYKRVEDVVEAYNKLGLVPEAPMEVILEARKRLMKEHHPDPQLDPEQKSLAETKFKEVTDLFDKITKFSW